MTNQTQTRLIENIAGMTASHDEELLECNLLKALDEHTNTRQQELLILKVDKLGQPCYQLSLRQDKYEIVLDSISLPDEIQTGIEIVMSTKQPLIRRIDSTRLFAIWHILQKKSQEVFLVMTTATKELCKLDADMTNGLLGVYRNCFAALDNAQRDQLTGLCNRKPFDTTIEKIHFNRPASTDSVTLERRSYSDPNNACYWLGMADLDDFKRINDTWGHLQGDEVLRQASEIMRDHFREGYDYLFRFGGEEFVIILRTNSEELAQSAFERFRAAIEGHQFPEVGQVTISIGVTKMRPGASPATLLDHADKALYEAKQNGRNQLCFFEQLAHKRTEVT